MVLVCLGFADTSHHITSFFFFVFVRFLSCVLLVWFRYILWCHRLKVGLILELCYKQD